MRWSHLAGVTAFAVFGATSGHATVYLTVAQAKAALFPGAASFVDRSLTLTAAQRKSIGASSGIPVRVAKVSVWEARNAKGQSLGFVYIDQVLGKHEFITYAVAIDQSGAVRDIEIMDYRETYGDQIRNQKWRAQFTGKRASAALKLDQDIKNISGATLSCKHVTEGVKRLLATHAYTSGAA